MDYFQLISAEGAQISFDAGFDKNIQAILQRKYENITDLSMYHIKIPEFICMAGVLFQPVFMVSEIAYECIRLYEPYIKSKRIVLYNEQYCGIFYILILESRLLEDKSSLFNRHILSVKDQSKDKVVVSLDLLESLLKRHIIGFQIKKL